MGLGVAWHSIAQRRSVSASARIEILLLTPSDKASRTAMDSDGQLCGTAMATPWMGQWSLMLDQLQLVDGTYW